MWSTSRHRWSGTIDLPFPKLKKIQSNLFSPTKRLMVKWPNGFLIPLCLFFQDGLVHMYDLQTGNWVSGYQAASGDLHLVLE